MFYDIAAKNSSTVPLISHTCTTTVYTQWLVLGTYDFFGLNHYTSSLVEHVDHNYSCINYNCDQDNQGSADPSWPE